MNQKQVDNFEYSKQQIVDFQNRETGPDLQSGSRAFRPPLQSAYQLSLTLRAKQGHVRFAFGRQLCLAVQYATQMKLITQRSVPCIRTNLLIFKQWIKCFSANIFKSLKRRIKIICYQNAAQNSSGNT